MVEYSTDDYSYMAVWGIIIVIMLMICYFTLGNTSIVNMFDGLSGVGGAFGVLK